MRVRRYIERAEISRMGKSVSNRRLKRSRAIESSTASPMNLAFAAIHILGARRRMAGRGLVNPPYMADDSVLS